MSRNGGNHRAPMVPPPSEAIREALERAAALISTHQSFVVTAHAHPDGDAICSSLAFFHMLRALGKEAVLFNVDEAPYNFQFLDGVEELTHCLPADLHPDVTCMLDCSNEEALGEHFPADAWGEEVLVIDHHGGKLPRPHISLQDPEAAAVGELVYRLCERLGVAIEGAIAESIYCSLMADTGGFRYASASPTAFAMAGQLVARGLSAWEMASRIYEENPVERVELLARVLSTLKVSTCGRLATIRITQAMLRSVGNDPSMIDGFINHARSIRGVEVAAQLREIGGRQYKVSFRSRGNVDVSELAQRFGGGGGRYAAGCVIAGTWSNVHLRLAEALAAQMDDARCAGDASARSAS